jgi:hypothetical protein
MKTEQILLRLLPAEVQKLDDLTRQLQARSRNHAVSILLNSIGQAQPPKVSIDNAILQPAATAKVEESGDILWA